MRDEQVEKQANGESDNKIGSGLEVGRADDALVEKIGQIGQTKQDRVLFWG